MRDVVRQGSSPLTQLSGSVPTFRSGWLDLIKGFRLWRLWGNLAWHGLHQRYKRTWLGMGWISLSFALFALVKIAIFGPISGKPIPFYAVNLVVGFLVFRYVANCINGGAALFVTSQNWIKSEPLPLSIHVFKLVLSNLIIFSFGAIPTLAVCIWFGYLNIEALISLPIVLLAMSLNGVWVSILAGILCTRYRDILHFTATVMQVLYFATPILWVPPETGFRAQVALWNPLTHYIAILREPVLTGDIPWLSWGVVGVGTGLGMILAYVAFSRSRLRIIYWL